MAVLIQLSPALDHRLPLLRAISMDDLDDVQSAVLSFALSSGESVNSVEFEKLLADYSVNIHDVIIVLEYLQSKIENFMVCLDGEL